MRKLSSSLLLHHGLFQGCGAILPVLRVRVACADGVYFLWANVHITSSRRNNRARYRIAVHYSDVVVLWSVSSTCRHPGLLDLPILGITWSLHLRRPFHVAICRGQLTDLGILWIPLLSVARLHWISVLRSYLAVDGCELCRVYDRQRSNRCYVPGLVHIADSLGGLFGLDET